MFSPALLPNSYLQLCGHYLLLLRAINALLVFIFNHFVSSIKKFAISSILIFNLLFNTPVSASASRTMWMSFGSWPPSHQLRWYRWVCEFRLRTYGVYMHGIWRCAHFHIAATWFALLWWQCNDASYGSRELWSMPLMKASGSSRLFRAYAKRKYEIELFSHWCHCIRHTRDTHRPRCLKGKSVHLRYKRLWIRSPTATYHKS